MTAAASSPTAGSAAKMRAYGGPAFLSFGFRPLFLLGAMWAAGSMGLWVLMLRGVLVLPTHLDPVSWHAHAFLFGYLSAIIAGFLLTAVPNWTGRLPLIGWRLAVLVVLWACGRLAVTFSSAAPLPAVVLIDLSMPMMLAVAIAREIIAGKNWRNLMVLAMLVAFVIANAIFHWEADSGATAAQGYGVRLGLATGIMLIAVVGGRVVPSFTRNWLVKQGSSLLPTPPMQRFDKLALLALLCAALAWVVSPKSMLTAALLIVVGVLHVARLMRWRGHLTLQAPIVTVLHAGYVFVPLGALAIGVEILLGVQGTASQHIWMAGGIGLMTLAVMTRASLGHSGREIVAGAGTVAIYGALILAVLARYAAGIMPAHGSTLLMLSAACWIGAFGGFALLYGPLLLRKRTS